MGPDLVRKHWLECEPEFYLRDIHVFVNSCDVLLEMALDRREFFTVDTDHAKVANLMVVEHDDSRRSTIWGPCQVFEDRRE